MEMPFGKYRGRQVEDIPLDYLEWLIENVELRDPRLRELVEELTGQEAPEAFPESTWKKRATGQAQATDGIKANLREAVDRWLRSSARKFHPDRGGSNELMKAINEGAETLLIAIDEAFARR